MERGRQRIRTQIMSKVRFNSGRFIEQVLEIESEGAGIESDQLIKVFYENLMEISTTW